MNGTWKSVVVTKVALAIFVPADGGKSYHENRPFHGLVLNEEGADKDYCFSDGTVLHTPGGELFYLPKGSTYRVKPLARGGCYAINFDAEDLTDVPWSLRFRNRDELFKLFRRAEREWRAPSDHRHVAVTEALYGILRLLLQESEKPYVPNEKAALLTPALKKMNADFTENGLSVSSLAALSGISEAYFRRLFSDLFGISPKEYLLRLRMDYAKQLLLSGQFSVSQTARLAGFAEPCHFSREFVKREGVPPSEYRIGAKAPPPENPQ